MNITKAVYKTSVVSKDKIINDGVPEFAFVGRSNVGKSSLINRLVNVKRLAKTSSTPGLTKMVNYFDINDKFRFVDLPGYGYAKVGRKQLGVWAGLMGEYLTSSPSLITVFVLVDIRHEPSELDKEMVRFLVFHQLPFIILATKCDKLSKTKTLAQVKLLASALSVREDFIIPTSSENGLGRDKILDYIENQLLLSEENSEGSDE